MINKSGYIKCVDNSGAKLIQCINIIRGNHKKASKIYFKGVVKSCVQGRLIKKGQIVDCLLLKSKAAKSNVMSAYLGCVILKPKSLEFEPIASRIYAPIQMVKSAYHKSIASLGNKKYIFYYESKRI